jgi:hypothetical protein
MQIIAYAVDVLPGHLVEAGFDHFRVEPDSVNSLISNQKNAGSRFYPNPLANDKTIFYTLPPAAQSTITINDLTGRTIETFTVNSATGSIDLNEIQAAGAYMLNVFQNGIKISTEKLVILED